MIKAHDRRVIALGSLALLAACATTEPPPAQGSGGGGNNPSSGGSGNTANGGTAAVVYAGSGGALPGTGGTPPGTGGTPPGTGGIPPGTGGTPPGTGGTPPGTGGTPPGTGGTPPATGGTAGTGGTPPVSTCTATGTWAATQVGGFVTATPWQGYGFTAKGGTGTTISPVNFMAATAGQALCACGSVGATYNDTAMIGINLNQVQGTTTVDSVTPSGTGIGITVSAAVAAPMRIQIQGPMGETVETQRWCADLPAGGGTVLWGDFAYHCWGDEMTAPYNGTDPIAAVLVMVPGTEAAATPFDFCITGLTNP